MILFRRKSRNVRIILVFGLVFIASLINSSYGQDLIDSDTYAEFHFDNFPDNPALEAQWQKGPGQYAEGVRIGQNPQDKSILFNEPNLLGRVLRLYGFHFSTDGTAACFVWPEEKQQVSARILSIGTAGNTVFNVSIQGDSLQLRISMIGKKEVAIISAAKLRPCAWNHVAVTWCNTTPMPYLRIYLDGTLVSSISDDVTPHHIGGNVLWLGSAPYWDKGEVWYTSFNFSGRIDDLVFSKRPVSEEEIRHYLKTYYASIIDINKGNK